MTVYCENANAAEIIFSLTGGKEGRLMSYAPPVEIFISRASVRYTIIKSSHFGNSATRTTVFDRILQFATQEQSESSGLFWNYGGDNTGTFYIFKQMFYGYRSNSSGVVFERILYSGAPPFLHLLLFNYQPNDVFVIQDMSGVIYAHKYPDGFTPTWQVNCIGCNAGECAGSDGKGGVVCMDCGQMDRDIQTIKRTLSK